MSITKQFIPSSFHKDPKILRSISLVVTVNLLIVIVAGLLAPLFFSIGFTEGGYIMTFNSLGACFYLGLLNYTKNIKLCGVYFMFHCMIMSMSLMNYTGGVSSPFSLCLFALGPIAYLYFKNFWANVWAVVGAGCYLLMMILQIFDYPFEQHLSDKYFYGLWGFMFSFVAYVFVSMVKGFQNGLKKFNRKLKGTNKELERFAYIASHDLKSPLRNITSFIHLFNKKYNHQIDDAGKEYLQIISTNAEQMQHLIEDILEYSHSNSREMKKEKVDLNIVVNQLAAQLLNEENYCQSEINFSNLPILESDFTQVKQVFQNLMENGLKYNDSVTKEINIEYQEKEKTIHFLIRDNGIGMEKEYHEQIFEMFKRLHNSGEYQGTGIGLAICKKIILQLGGTVTVESKVGVGSTFHLVFPKSILWVECKSGILSRPNPKNTPIGNPFPIES